MFIVQSSPHRSHTHKTKDADNLLVTNEEADSLVTLFVINKRLAFVLNLVPSSKTFTIKSNRHCRCHPLQKALSLSLPYSSAILLSMSWCTPQDPHHPPCMSRGPPSCFLAHHRGCQLVPMMKPAQIVGDGIGTKVSLDVPHHGLKVVVAG